MTIQENNEPQKGELAIMPQQQIAKRQPVVNLRINSVQDLVTLGTIANKSGLYKFRSSEQCFMAICRGADLGLSPSESLSGIYFLDGKLTLSGGLMAAMIDNSPAHRYKVIVSTEKRCQIDFYRYYSDTGWDLAYSSDFTIEEAKKAGLLTKSVWANYPKSMLFWRTLSQGARAACAGLFMGSAYTPEEMGVEMDESGSAILNDPPQSDDEPRFSDNTPNESAKPNQPKVPTNKKTVPFPGNKTTLIPSNPHYVSFLKELREMLGVERDFVAKWLVDRHVIDPSGKPNPSILPASQMDNLLYAIINNWHERTLNRKLEEESLWSCVNKVSFLSSKESQNWDVFSLLLDDIQTLTLTLSPEEEGEPVADAAEQPIAQPVSDEDDGQHPIDILSEIVEDQEENEF